MPPCGSPCAWCQTMSSSIIASAPSRSPRANASYELRTIASRSGIAAGEERLLVLAHLVRRDQVRDGREAERVGEAVDQVEVRADVEGVAKRVVGRAGPARGGGVLRPD